MVAPSSPRRRARRREKLGYFPIWTYAHPTAIQLAARLAELAPGDLNRVFFTTGGSEAVESAWKLARQYFRLTGEPGRYKVISRYLAYHGTSMGAPPSRAWPSSGCPSSRSCRVRARWPTRTATGARCAHTPPLARSAVPTSRP